MPFDGTKLRYSLAEGVAALGITPVPDSVLEAHKQAELAKHPGDWWFNHRRFLDVMLGVSLFMTLVCLSGTIVLAVVAIFATSSLWLFAAIISLLGLIGFIVCVGTIQGTIIKGPAKWLELIYSHAAESSRELVEYSLFGVPPVIADMAYDIVKVLPNCDCVLGELKQESTTLDPYLLVRDRDTGEQVVLGIWDGDRIIHLAAQL